MEMPEGLKTLRWADDIALLKAEFKDEISVKRLNRLGMLVEALKAENEELKALNKGLQTDLDDGREYIEQLKDKLEKAKDCIEFYAFFQGKDGNIGHRARTTLEGLE